MQRTTENSSHRPGSPESHPLSRRGFLRRTSHAALATGAAMIVPRHVLGGAGFVPPSEKVNIALIGAGGRGRHLFEDLVKNGIEDAQVIAICDVNERADYSKFYYRSVSGRLPMLELVDKHYAPRKEKGEYAGCKGFIDYRKMLDEEKAIDAVMVATPDHNHAVVSLAAMRLGKHVYCEKPLAHSIEEVRAMTEEARRSKVATQMGNQGNSTETHRQICEWIWDGAIGPVREVHAWSDTGGWTNDFIARPTDTPPVPPGLDWNLWLGPARERPYHPAYAPYNWRGWWDFGTGAIGDMGCHNIDPAFRALKLGFPESIEASSTKVNDETVPLASIIHYTFPAREGMPPVKLTWYDCGLFPAVPEELPRGTKLDKNGILFVGEKGKLLCGGWSQSPRLLPESRMKEYKQPAKTLPRVKSHDRAWIDAAKGGPAASSQFEYGGPLTELVLLGNVALRSGGKIYWDGPGLRATGSEKAQDFVKAGFRPGWTL